MKSKKLKIQPVEPKQSIVEKKERIYIFWTETTKRNNYVDSMFFPFYRIGESTYVQHAVVDTMEEAYEYKDKHSVQFIKGIGISLDERAKVFNEIYTKKIKEKEEILKKLTPEERKVLGL